MVAAQIRAPPSGEVVASDAGQDHEPQAHLLHGGGDPFGLILIDGSGRAVITSQKPHRRVHRSPRIRNVASRASQHSPMFGHIASSQTVCRSRPRMIDVSSAWLGPDASLTFSHGGLRPSDAGASVRDPPPVETIGR